VVEISEYRRLCGQVIEFKDYLRSGPGFDDLDLPLTIGEIRLGIEQLRRKDPVQADALERWFRGLRSSYPDRVVDIDVETAEEWGRMNVPDPLPVIDGMLAATAKVRGWTLATRSTADLARSGATLLNPFDGLA
jgi:toxin FitB